MIERDMAEFVHDDEGDLVAGQVVSHDRHLFVEQNSRGTRQLGDSHVRPEVQYGWRDTFPGAAEAIRSRHLISRKVVNQIAVQMLQDWL